jgi:tRNA pseudouridine38-40 synthase
VWWVKDALDADRMRGAAKAFVGMRDFAAFAEKEDTKKTADKDTEAKSTIVLIERLDVIEDGDLVLVGIEGSHFLWKMVRRIVGVLVEIGRGALETDAAAQLLASDSNMPARLTAPASGLFLDRVFYKNDGRDAPLRAATPL